ncbi:MAG: histidine kinase [Clostridiales bacterium]|nr:histidine kinase [Clostridiales bacterium]
MNPHFIYNVLNVISYRGAMIDDEVICDMCFNLAEMLRYSTNTKERQSTIEEEVEYLKRYLYLLKQRYQHKLEYIIDMDASVANQVIPKVVLQSLVENSINHGFNNVDKIMEISIKGWSEKGWWYISIEDNGQGFSETTKVKLLEKMKEVKDIIKNVDQNLELEIGGMGLINSYGRLLLLYEDDFSFEITSNKEGTRITIGAIIKGNED